MARFVVIQTALEVSMSRPRPVLPGSVVFVTRRCLERRFFLRPDKKARALFAYLFAVACDRSGVEPVAVCAMSNHYHAVLHDAQGRLPHFLQLFHSLLARSVNCHRGRWDRFWDGQDTHVCLPGDGQDAIRKAAYTLANPSAAGLVANSGDWPGFRSKPGACTRRDAQVFRRPEGFFADDSSMPEGVELRFVVPPNLDTSPEAFADELNERVRKLDGDARDEARAAGRDFLGVADIRRQPWDERPKTRASRREMAPRIAAKDKATRLALIATLKTFVERYREALTAFCEGTREVAFPPGTWLMCRRYGATAHPPPPV